MSARVSIVATGIHVPEREVTNPALRARIPAEHHADLDRFAEVSGIRTRFHAPDDWATSDLAVAACRDALGRARVAPEEVDLIVLGTDTPDHLTPATSVVVAHQLGARRAGTFDVGCACASFPTAIAAAAGIMETSAGIDTVLVAGAYLMQRLADPADPMTFFYGDGAGAVVLKRSEAAGVLAASFRADGSYAPRWSIASGGTREPATVESVRAGRTRVRLTDRYPSSVNEEGWPVLVREVTDRAGIGVRDVDLFVFTQVRRNTIERVMTRLEQPMEKTHMVMDRWGYTGSACIPMALHDAVERGRVRADDLVVLVGSGVGYNQAAVAIRASRELVASGGAS